MHPIPSEDRPSRPRPKCCLTPSLCGDNERCFRASYARRGAVSYPDLIPPLKKTPPCRPKRLGIVPRYDVGHGPALGREAPRPSLLVCLDPNFDRHSRMLVFCDGRTEILAEETRIQEDAGDRRLAHFCYCQFQLTIHRSRSGDDKARAARHRGDSAGLTRRVAGSAVGGLAPSLERRGAAGRSLSLACLLEAKLVRL